MERWYYLEVIQLFRHLDFACLPGSRMNLLQDPSSILRLELRWRMVRFSENNQSYLCQLLGPWRAPLWSELIAEPSLSPGMRCGIMRGSKWHAESTSCLAGWAWRGSGSRSVCWASRTRKAHPGTCSACPLTAGSSA